MPKATKTASLKDLSKLVQSVKADEESAFVNLRSINGLNWAEYFVLLGARMAGKSYAVMKEAIKKKLRLKDKMKFYWLRLTETSIRGLLEADARKLVDADLVRKYNLHLVSKGNEVWNVEEDGSEWLFCTVLAISTFYNKKGVAYFDKDFNGEYFIVCDEMNREKSEKNNFDIVYNFKNQLENLIRNTGSEQAKGHAKVFLIGNTLSEASDMLLAFGFLPEPGKFGRYKLKRKKCVIDYLPLTESYKKMRRGATVDILKSSDDSTFTNEVEMDRSLLWSKKLVKPQAIIKFTSNSPDWFVVWDDGVINTYHGEQIKTHIAMRRYIQCEMYIKEQVENVYQLFDTRCFKFKTFYIQQLFRKQLRLLKPQR